MRWVRRSHSTESRVEVGHGIVVPLPKRCAYPPGRWCYTSSRSRRTLGADRSQPLGGRTPLAIGAENGDDSFTALRGWHPSGDQAATQRENVLHPRLSAPAKGVETANG